jgi:hypothetical protein
MLLRALGTDCTDVLVGFRRCFDEEREQLSVCHILFFIEMRIVVFQASPSTQLFGEAERDGAAGTRGLPTHHTRTAHESEAVYQGIY